MGGFRKSRTGLHTDEHRRLVRALATLRMEAGLTQEELAKRVGADQSYVAKYEGGQRRLDVVEFMRIIAAIGADPHQIIALVWPKT